MKTIVSETHSITFLPKEHAVSWKLPKNAQFGQFFFLLKVCVKRVGAYVIIPSLTAKEAESPENTGSQPLFTHQKCSYILLLFSFFNRLSRCLNHFSHSCISKDFIVGTKACDLMQGICQISSCIGGVVTELFSGTIHLHVSQCTNNVTAGVFAGQSFLQNPENK